MFKKKNKNNVIFKKFNICHIYIMSKTTIKNKGNIHYFSFSNNNTPLKINNKISNNKLNCNSKINKKANKIHTFKDIKIKNKKRDNNRTKEKEIVKEIKNIYNNYDWVENRKIEDGESNKRPDLMCNFGSHILIIEIDEKGHRNYDKEKEYERMIILFKDVKCAPIVCIRFNPDEYIDCNNNKITSCWKKDCETGEYIIKKTKEKEWSSRLNMLIYEIGNWINKPSEKDLEIIKLFY